MGCACLQLHETCLLYTSYGYDIKDAIIEQAKTLKETCEDLAAEAKEKYEDRKAEEQKPAVTPAPTVVPEDSKKE